MKKPNTRDYGKKHLRFRPDYQTGGVVGEVVDVIPVRRCRFRDGHAEYAETAFNRQAWTIPC